MFVLNKITEAPERFSRVTVCFRDTVMLYAVMAVIVHKVSYIFCWRHIILHIVHIYTMGKLYTNISIYFPAANTFDKHFDFLG